VALDDVCAVQLLAIIGLLISNAYWYWSSRIHRDDRLEWQDLWKDRCRRVEKLEERLHRLVSGLRELLDEDRV
jgi:hypothetical protein